MISIADIYADFCNAVGHKFLSISSKMYVAQAKEYFQQAEEFMSGSDMLLKDTGRRTNPFLARMCYIKAEQVLLKSGGLDDKPLYQQAFGVTQEEFRLKVTEARMEEECPWLGREFGS